MEYGSSFMAKTPVFNGHNYPVWLVKMKAYLKAFNLWEVVETDQQPPPLRQNPTLAKIKQHTEEVTKRYKALTCIHSAVTDEILDRIMRCETAKEAWDLLKEEFQDRIMKIVNRIRLLGDEELSDRRVVEKVLVSLPEKFEHKISSLEDSKDLSKIPLTELINSLQAVEQRKALRSQSNVEGALLATEKGKSQQKEGAKKQFFDKKWKEKKEFQRDFKGGRYKGKKESFPPCIHCKKTTHTENFCWFRPGVQCRSCKQFGHVEKVCKSKADSTAQAQIAEKLDQQEEKLFVATKVEACCAMNLSCNVWLIDSGCTHHMTPNESCFKSLDKSFTSKVRLGNGELVEVKGRGVATVDTPTSIKLIYDVLFVPEISYSLISVAQLVENKYSLHFHDKLCDVFDEFGDLLLSVKMLDKSFPIEWKETQIKACVSTVENSCVWHKRFGHSSYQSLLLMQKKSMVSGMPLVHVDEHVCKVCQLGKHSQLPFPSGQAHKASMKLQLVHTDICGPMKTVSLSGNRYFLIFIDDFSIFCWVYFLKHKSEVFDIFIKFKASVENECGLNIKTLRSDNAAEYTSHRFQQFLQHHGIHHQLTIPYTPQQNGALYGLKQAPRAWNCKIDDHLLSLGFEKSLSEATLYVKKKNGVLVIVSIYVDDLLVTGNDEAALNQFKIDMLQIFDMNDLGKMTYFLGMEIDQSSKGIFICQRNFTGEILSKFAMSNCRPVSTPSVSGVKYQAIDGSTNVDAGVYRSMIGSLLYLSATRPDIMHAVSFLSRFMHSPTEVHLKGVKRIFRYLKATAGFGVFYPRAEKIKLLGFCDGDWVGSEDDMKSTIGFCFTLGLGVISWCSQKQVALAHSTTEAEYIAAATAVDKAIWLRKLLVNVHHAQSNPTEMLCDSKAAVAIAKNPVFHGKTKHFKLKYHIVRVAENDGDIVMVHCSSEENVADIFTKGL
ncbi:hypothetical protein SLEP1_g45235 [Rubroshorea leprosula]|uniref:Integrase catalytic domain-containing protein n=2 Tax=Rubroshorea leprosula TaxID=152421 RepID=A0AAV5LIG2_9ROSI|nr:hypothetical protein SLEP1_g45235 [Rubroshorea leprosula]